MIPEKSNHEKLRINICALDNEVVGLKENMDSFITLYKNGLYSIKFNDYYSIYGIEKRDLAQIAHSIEKGEIKTQLGKNGEYRVFYKAGDKKTLRGDILIYSESAPQNYFKKIKTDSREGNLWIPELILVLKGEELEKFVQLIKKSMAD